jgi:hypothetical protein
MRDMSTGWRAGALAAALCVMVPAAAGCGALKQIGADSHTGPAQNFTITAHITTVIINGGAASITVTGSNRNTILVSQQPYYSKKPPATVRRVDGTTLTLSYNCATEVICGVTYNVEVPRGVAVRVGSLAGAVTITSVSGAVSAQTGAGLITATDLSSPTAQLKSNAGGIVAAFTVVPASVQASTNVGPISMTLPGSASYKISTHTIVGTSNVSVRKDASSPHVITASSYLGSITISPS